MRLGLQPAVSEKQAENSTWSHPISKNKAATSYPRATRTSRPACRLVLADLPSSVVGSSKPTTRTDITRSFLSPLFAVLWQSCSCDSMSVPWLFRSAAAAQPVVSICPVDISGFETTTYKSTLITGNTDMHDQLPDEDRLSMSETARLLKRHSATIWRWVLRGIRGYRLRSIHVGGRRYITRQDLEAFLAAVNVSERPGSRGTPRMPHQKGNGKARAGCQPHLKDVDDELDCEGL